MNVQVFFLALLCIGGVFWLAEWLTAKGKVSIVVARKMLHIVAVSLVAVSPTFVSNKMLLTAILLVGSVLLLTAVANNWLQIDKGRRKSWGIALFPVAFLGLWWCFSSRPWLVIYPMLVLAFADAAAAIVGEAFAKHFFVLTKDRKSWIGSISFAIIAFLVLFFLPKWLGNFHPLLQVPKELQHNWGYIVVIVSLLCAATEALASGGFDNLLVPWLAGWLLAFLPILDGFVLLKLMTAILVFTCLGWLAWRKKWLDAGGTITAIILGFVIYATSGRLGMLPMTVFFVSGSILSKLKKGSSAFAGDKKQVLPRDYMQVLCNGGVAGILLIGDAIFHWESTITLVYISIAVSTADTWSSEIGNRAKGKVWDILTWRPVVKGVSGGVSVQGTIAGASGALLIGLVALWNGWHSAGWIAVLGWLGMLIDSALGSRLQVKYLVNDEKNGKGTLWLDETPSDKTEIRTKGLQWVSNDVVNLLSNLVTVVLVVVFWMIFCRK